MKSPLPRLNLDPGSWILAPGKSINQTGPFRNRQNVKVTALAISKLSLVSSTNKRRKPLVRFNALHPPSTSDKGTVSLFKFPNQSSGE
jgi:hypothetical protein